MLFEFHKSSNATVATKNICDVYPSALDVRKCQRWFSMFKSGNFDPSDSYRSGRPTTLDNDMLRAKVEANPCQTIEESIIQEHLQQIGKVRRAGVWVPHNLSEENKANRFTTCNLLLQRHNTEGWEVLPYPPYSPDIAPSDFRSLQHFLIGKKFENLDDVQNAISKYFAQKPIDFYRSDIKNYLHIKWQKVAHNKSDYIID
ncbi:Histone-lysine N-methyltransferase SETMAR [Melipona quadrifasciata]|uniref:Histone-lysine N-methyltransferase SETMAR n=1 Tax=Melipona quadrifasciata TaxID=166423 RepID=A0A0N0U392_9HYME|nr:Histone-lysine N-methyltransferase SETMAR [Melipona quadrifasciata]